ncbi:primosomal replication protein [Aliivibrio kagoshimensis]|jgi:primosomal replication protein N''|uniref:primosomal replication protein n=1 Tax=Aliivibrio kagoshimensis TaxID=2910230 RepID=UPI003D0EABFE
MVELSSLQPLLEQLSITAAQIDRTRGEQHTYLFDERLFSCRSRLLVPCVNESKSLLKSMINEQSAGLLTTARAEHLCEKLIAQIQAMQREIKTQSIRSSEPKHYSHFRKPIGEMHQDLAQHKEWERRLILMVKDKEQQLQRCYSLKDQPTIQKELLSTEQRLEKCQQAMIKLEQRIAYREQNNEKR